MLTHLCIPERSGKNSYLQHCGEIHTRLNLSQEVKANHCQLRQKKMMAQEKDRKIKIIQRLLILVLHFYTSVFPLFKRQFCFRQKNTCYTKLMMYNWHCSEFLMYFIQPSLLNQSARLKKCGQVWCYVTIKLTAYHWCVCGSNAHPCQSW